MSSIIQIIICYSQLDVVPISWMLKQSFSLVIEFPIEFHYSDLLLRKLSILIWKAAWMPGQDNGSRIIARKSLTTGLFSSNKASPDACAACHEYDTSSSVCMCVFVCATQLNLNIPRSLPYIFHKCLKFYFFKHLPFCLFMMNFGWERKGGWEGKWHPLPAGFMHV